MITSLLPDKPEDLKIANVNKELSRAEFIRCMSPKLRQATLRARREGAQPEVGCGRCVQMLFHKQGHFNKQVRTTPTTIPGCPIAIRGASRLDKHTPCR